MLAIGVFSQAFLLVGIGWYNYPTEPPREFFGSLPLLAPIFVTSTAIVLLGVIPLLRHCDKNEGFKMCGAGLILWYLFHYHGLSTEWWTVNVFFLTFATWGIIVGVAVLLHYFLYEVAGW